LAGISRGGDNTSDGIAWGIAEASALRRRSVLGNAGGDISIVDKFLTELEEQVLAKLNEEERTPIPEAWFLSAQSQMWIFAAYEVLRTWRQRANDIVRWADNGGLKHKLEALEKKLPYPHTGRLYRAEQIRRVIADPTIVDKTRNDLRLTHMVFARLGAVRISLAKHEIKGRKASIAERPGYGRINQWCGSLDYELEHSQGSLGYISRRDIADEIRALATQKELPSDEMIEHFDTFMRGPPDIPF